MTRTRRHLVLAALAATPVFALATAAQADTVYTGPNNGDWNFVGNWSFGVPSTAIDTRVNNNASNVTVLLANNQTGNTAGLTIDAGDAVNVGDNSTLNIGGNLVNNGTLKFLPVGNTSYLNFGSPTASITGSGVIDLNYGAGPGQARLNTVGSGVVTNHSTVRGSGYLYDIRFVNASDGVIENNQTSGSLYIDAFGNTGSFVNNGVIRALAGSTVSLAGDFGGDDSFTGTGTYLATGAGAVFQLVNDATVVGGTFSSNAGGEVVVPANHNVSISGSANTGTFRVRNNATLRVSGAINNTGTMIVNAGANDAHLTIAADTTLSGTGSIVLTSDPTQGLARINGTNGVLTIGAGQTIRGGGYIYDGRVVNNGTIQGDATSAQGGMYIDAWGGDTNAFINNGTIKATANSFVSLVGDFGGDDAFRGNGTYRADGTNALLHLANSVEIIGGNFTTTAGGEIRVPAGHTARLTGPTITTGSTVAVLNNARLYLTGNTSLVGTVDVRAGANDASLTSDADATISGGGSIVLNSNPGVSSARMDGGGKVTLATGATIKGNGFLYDNRLVNNGLVLADRATGSMYLDSWGGGAVGEGIVNNGTMQAIAGATLTLSGELGGNDQFTGAGTYRADGAGAFINLINDANIVGGTFTTTAGGVIQVPAGHAVTITDSTISAGSKLDVQSNARLYLNGTPTINGTLQVTSGTSDAYLTINGTTNLNVGTLSLTSNPGVTNARVDGGGVLTIGPNFTVSGNGFFYDSRTVNNGTILAERATGSMYIDSYGGDAAGSGFKNNGTIKAAAGATVNLAGDFGGQDQFTGNGTYRADGAGALVQLINNVEIIGGNYTTTLGGVVRVPGGHNVSVTSPTITPGTNVEVLDNARLNVNTTVVNNGTLTVTAGVNEATLTTASDTVFSGSGVTRLTSNGGVRARLDGGGLLTISAGHTLAGNGYVYDHRVINNGTILADQASGDMYLDAWGGGTNAFVNNGTIRAAAGATVTFAGDFGGDDRFAGTGPIVADGTIRATNSAEGDVGPVTGNGSVRGENGATLGYQSIRAGSIVADGGMVRITAGGGNTGTSKVSSLTVNKNNNGRLDLTDHGIIVDYTGASPVSDIRDWIANGRNAGNWNGTGIMSSLANNANRRAIGYLDTATLTSVPASFLGQTPDGTSVLIRYTILGDATLDGAVAFNDLVALAQNYSTNAAAWGRGDFNYDGTVNFDDLVLLAQNYNSSALTGGEMAALTSSAGSDFASDWALAQAMAPEPASTTAVLGLIGVIARRGRRQG